MAAPLRIASCVVSVTVGDVAAPGSVLDLLGTAAGDAEALARGSLAGRLESGGSSPFE